MKISCQSDVTERTFNLRNFKSISFSRIELKEENDYEKSDE